MNPNPNSNPNPNPNPRPHPNPNPNPYQRTARMGNISGMAGVSFGLAATIGSMDWSASQYVQLAAVLGYVENEAFLAGQPLPARPVGRVSPRLADPKSCPRYLLALFKPARGSSGRTLVGAVFHIGAGQRWRARLRHRLQGRPDLSAADGGRLPLTRRSGRRLHRGGRLLTTN